MWIPENNRSIGLSGKRKRSSLEEVESHRDKEYGDGALGMNVNQCTGIVCWWIYSTEDGNADQGRRLYREPAGEFNYKLGQNIAGTFPFELSFLV